MRILLTGATGWVGVAAVEVLGRDHWLRCTTHRIPMEPPANGECVAVDLATYADAEAVVKDIDAIVHMARADRGEYETTELPMKSSVVATANLLEAAHRAGIQRFVLVSSGAVVTVYPHGTYIHAGLPHKFRRLYNLSKSLQERVAEQYAEEYGMVVPCLRPWSVVDGRIRQYRTGEPLRYDPKQFYGLICRYDFAEACLAALTAPLQGFQTFHTMATEAARPWFDVERTERLLGWKPKITFEDLVAE